MPYGLCASPSAAAARSLTWLAPATFENGAGIPTHRRREL